MPIYEYRCDACGMEKEFLQKISDPLLTTCPSCGKEALVKKLTAAGFQLKGSGWYVTDFRNNGAAATTKDANKDAKAGADKAAGGGGGDSSTAGAEKSDAGKKETKEAAAPSGGTPATPSSTSASTPSSSSSS